MNDGIPHTYGRQWYQFITDKMNKPLTYFLGHLFDRLPVPTKENTRWETTHLLIDIRDEFFKHETKNPHNRKALEAIFNILIVKYDYDMYYHKRVDWVIDKLIENKDKWLSMACHLKSDQWWEE